MLGLGCSSGCQAQEAPEYHNTMCGLYIFSHTYDYVNLTVPATLWVDRNFCGHHLLPVGSDLHCLAFAASGVVGPGSPPLGIVMLALVQLGKSIFVPSSDSFRLRDIME